MKKTKKEVEKYYLEKFSALVNIDSANCEQCDPPKPDFIINGEKKLGIEITNYHFIDGSLPFSERVQTARRQAIANLANKMYLENGHRNLKIFLGFNTIDRANKIIAEDICAFVRAHQDLPTGDLTYYAKHAIPEIAYLYLYSNVHSTYDWQVSQVHDVSLIDNSRLLSIIQSKELKHYEGCDSVWLVVVMDMMDPSQEQEINESSLLQVQSKKFDKIFLYKTVYEKIYIIGGSK